MERWARLWILGFVAIVPGKAVPDLTGINMANGTWRAPITLPCMYEPSADFKEVKVTWKFLIQGEEPHSIFLRDSSGDHTFLAAFRHRISVAKKSPGDVSLQIKELEMTDTGAYTCSVQWEAKNMSKFTEEKMVQLQVVKVPASKPAIQPSRLESVLPNGTRVSLTCSANGSPPIKYRWYKERPGREAEYLQMGAVLAFNSLQPHNSARYFCTAENRLSVQKEQSDSFQLTVKDASEFSTAGPSTEEHPTDGMVTSSTPFRNPSGQQGESARKLILPLYLIILISVLCAALIIVVVSVIFCRRKTKKDSIYEVTYNNNALTLANEHVLASSGVDGPCVYEEPNLHFGNTYSMEPTKADEYVLMNEKMDNEYEILVTEKRLGN
ncbi:V-set and immunoglobulin domain-containing protein 4 isoform X1 [Python bivittatus]|uniref:V-set and immunoglobulin domain-containing protein 4 isoform X1 n=1 Tax=Python bivittatus TaxID=176946 RepID=UPI000D6A3DB2|nr:V-set and immunoglobulin domain-containing protein 4 isoform X1 [Python bivittatus]